MQRIRYSRYFKIIFILIDLIIVSGVFLYFFLRDNQFSINPENWEDHLAMLFFLILFWALLSGRTRLYSISRNLTYTLYLEKLVSHMFIFILGMFLLSLLNKTSFLRHDRTLIAIALFLILATTKSLIFFALKYFRRRGVNHRNIMFLDNTFSADLLKSTLESRRDYGFKVIDYPKDQEINIENLKTFWRKNGIHTMFLPSTDSHLNPDFENLIFREAEMAKVRINLIPTIVQNNFYEYDLSYVETQPVLAPAKFPLDQLSNYILKRTFDIIFSLFILVFVFSWLYPLVALLIKLDSPGPVFFKQKRYGFHDQVFLCYKFRTMVVNKDSATKTTAVNDNRITKLGKFLRKSSIDEFPQFLNVLKGDMSIVGPRPHMILVDEFYKSKIRRFSLRSAVKPGITGLAQVNGHRGDRENMDVEMQKRVLADIFYVRNWSLVLDFIIVFKTAYLVIFGDKNAH